MKHNDAWYYDEDSDTIIFNGEGDRSNYARSNPSIETPLVNFDIAYYLDQ